ncbi:MAG: hypothetical protein HXX20_01540 [Chloroflexi bacterium]|nr:hypothetical protein [Chloroflexota bacterium]
MHSNDFDILIKRLQAELDEQKVNRSEIEELKARLAGQETEIQYLRQQLTSNALKKLTELGQTQPTSRRTMLRRMGGATVGLAALGLVSGVVNQTTAQAADPSIESAGTVDNAPIRLDPIAAAPAATGHSAGALYSQGDAGGLDSSLKYYRGTNVGWVPLSSTVFLSSPLRVIGGATEYPTGTPLVNGLYTWPPPTNTTKYNFINYYQIEGTWGPAGQTQTIPKEAVGIICTFTASGGTTGFAVVFPGSSINIPLASTVNYAAGVKNFATGATIGLGVIPNTATRVYPSTAAIGLKGIAVSSYSNVSVLVDVIAYIL